MVECNNCKEKYQSIDGYFYNRKDGSLIRPCKSCIRARTQRRYRENSAQINERRRNLTKTCKEWRENKKASDAKSYAKNKEKRLQRFAEYRSRPEVAERNKKYFKEIRNRPGFVDGKRQYLKQYHADAMSDPDKVAALRKKANDYWRENREKYRSHVRNRRARIKQASGRHTESDVKRKLIEQNFICYWCGCDISDDRHTVDHYIPIAKCGSNGPENIVMACATCNCSKQDKMPDEFREYLGKYKKAIPA